MKYVVFLCDGMADRPIPQLGGITPLAYARHPHMDRMAGSGLFGMAQTVPDGMPPGSDTANLSVMGYDPRVYYSGRSPLEAASIGVPLEADDVTYRCNFVTLSQAGSLEDARMLDYSAGEISTEEAATLVAFLNERIADDTRRLYAGFFYRHCLVLRHGETGAELTQPHDISGQPVRGRLPKGRNGAQLADIMTYAYGALAGHPVNQKRVAAGLNPANCVWFWGEGRKPKLKPFIELYGIRGAVVSAVDLIQGIGLCAGMTCLRVPGATGNYLTNYAGKGEAAIRALREGADFVYIHVEAPDECGHRGQIEEKVYSIERIDEQIVGPVLAYLDGCGEDYAALLMPDHPTPIELMTHTGEPVPFALMRGSDRSALTARYSEETARQTGVFVPQAHTLLPAMFAGPGASPAC